MSTYNNVLGNFTSRGETLSDLDDEDGPYEDSGSEPEPQMGIAPPVPRLQPSIDRKREILLLFVLFFF